MNGDDALEFTTGDGMREDVPLRGNAPPGQGHVISTDVFASPHDDLMDPFHLENPSSDANVTFVGSDGVMREYTLYGASHDADRSEFHTLLHDVAEEMGLDTTPADAPAPDAGDQSNTPPAPSEDAGGDGSAGEPGGSSPTLVLHGGVQESLDQDYPLESGGGGDDFEDTNSGSPTHDQQVGEDVYQQGAVEGIDNSSPTGDQQTGGDASQQGSGGGTDDGSPSSGQPVGLQAETPIWDPAGGPMDSANSETAPSTDGVLLKGGIEQDEYHQPPQDLGGELDPYPARGGELDPLPSRQLQAETPIWDPAGGQPPNDLPEGAYVMGSSSATTDVHAELWQGDAAHPWPDLPGAGDDDFTPAEGQTITPPVSDSQDDLQFWANNTGTVINQAIQDTIQEAEDQGQPWTDDPNAQGNDAFSHAADFDPEADYVSNPASSGYDPTSPAYNPRYDSSRPDYDSSRDPGSSSSTGDGDAAGSTDSQGPDYQQAIATGIVNPDDQSIDTYAVAAVMFNTESVTYQDLSAPAQPYADPPSYQPGNDGTPGNQQDVAPQGPDNPPDTNAQPDGSGQDNSQPDDSQPDTSPPDNTAPDTSAPDDSVPDASMPADPAPEAPPPPEESAPSSPDGGATLGANLDLAASTGYEPPTGWDEYGSADPFHDPMHYPGVAGPDHDLGLF